MRTARGHRVVVSLAVGTSDLQSMTAKQGLPEGDKLEEYRERRVVGKYSG